jgi:hypothetical protein
MCQRALRERATFSVPATIIDASNVTAIRLQMAADKTGRSLRDLGGWQDLQTTYSFTTVPGQFNYPLPDGYLRMVGMTNWNRSQIAKMMGPTPPSQWQALVAGNALAPTGVQYWRVLQKSFYIWPIPQSEDTITFEYVTRNWVIVTGENNPTKEYFAADTDTCVFEDDLMVSGIKERYQSIILGVDFEPSGEYDALIGARVSADAGSPVIDYGARNTSSVTSEGNIPDNNWPSS